MRRKRLSFYVEVVRLEEREDITLDDVLTIGEAADMLGVTMQSIQSFLDRGKLTTVRSNTSRRLCLKSEVLELKQKRGGQSAA